MGDANALNTLWLVVATILVYGMQNGFLLLEGGHVRSKNSINVAQKNLVDWMVTTILFLSFGFWIMFGVSAPLTSSSHVDPINFLFQLALSATAASIVSGGVAERITFRGYLTIVVLTSGLFYPLLGRLVWGDLHNSDVWAGLAAIGFKDFAGATVVHALGAWVALGAILAIGPRRDRFLEDGTPRALSGFNTVISLSGALLLIFGWLGFNAGLVPANDVAMQFVLMNTLVCGAFGSLAGMLLGIWLDNGIANPDRLKTALIGGLVASSASAFWMKGIDAIVIGSIGGFTAVLAGEILLRKFKLDDPLEVVSAHGVAGVIGTVAVAFVLPESLLVAGSRIAQTLMQLGVSIALMVLITTISYVFVKLMGRFVRMRVSPEEEYLGLNITEHGAAIAGDALKHSLLLQLKSGSDEIANLNIDANDEQADLAQIVNLLLAQQRETNVQLEESVNRFTQFADVASDWLWETDETLVFTYISLTASGPKTLLNSAAVGKRFEDVFVMQGGMAKKLRKALLTHEAFDFLSAEISLQEEERVTLHVELRGQPYFDKNGRLSGYRGSVVDVTPRKAAEARAYFLAMHDELTRLPSRRALKECLPRVMDAADENSACVALAGIDLDGFKPVNDTYGHEVGDHLLKRVAQRLTHNLGNNCSVYRTGGDEFIFLMANMPRDEGPGYAVDMCERLRERISKPYLIDTLAIEIGASFGVSFYPAHNVSGNDLTRMADFALYAAKEKGKGQVAVYQPSMDKDKILQDNMRSELINAIENDEFYFEYQPIIDVKTGKLHGTETLIRWLHPERGNILPSGFIPLAEKLNFSDEIFTYLMTVSCTVAVDIGLYAGEKGKQIQHKMAINVSTSQLLRQNFVALLEEYVEGAGLLAENVEIEVTSKSLSSVIESASPVLHELWTRGYMLVVDDFGSGNLPIEKLISCAVGKVKINRNLINQLDKNERTLAVVSTLVDICKNEGISVCASGVESERQFELVKKMGCDKAQGYHIARPMEFGQLLEWIDQTDGKLEPGAKAA